MGLLYYYRCCAEKPGGRPNLGEVLEKVKAIQETGKKTDEAARRGAAASATGGGGVGGGGGPDQSVDLLQLFDPVHKSSVGSSSGNIGGKSGIDNKSIFTNGRIGKNGEGDRGGTGSSAAASSAKVGANASRGSSNDLPTKQPRPLPQAPPPPPPPPPYHTAIQNLANSPGPPPYLEAVAAEGKLVSVDDNSGMTLAGVSVQAERGGGTKSTSVISPGTRVTAAGVDDDGYEQGELLQFTSAYADADAPGAGGGASGDDDGGGGGGSAQRGHAETMRAWWAATPPVKGVLSGGNAGPAGDTAGEQTQAQTQAAVAVTVGGVYTATEGAGGTGNGGASAVDQSGYHTPTVPMVGSSIGAGGGGNMGVGGSIDLGLVAVGGGGSSRTGSISCTRSTSLAEYGVELPGVIQAAMGGGVLSSNARLPCVCCTGPPPSGEAGGAGVSATLPPVEGEERNVQQEAGHVSVMDLWHRGRTVRYPAAADKAAMSPNQSESVIAVHGGGSLHVFSIPRRCRLQELAVATELCMWR